MSGNTLLGTLNIKQPNMNWLRFLDKSVNQKPKIMPKEVLTDFFARVYEDKIELVLNEGGKPFATLPKNGRFNIVSGLKNGESHMWLQHWPTTKLNDKRTHPVYRPLGSKVLTKVNLPLSPDIKWLDMG